MSEQSKIWTCKIGEVDPNDVPDGADQPMREAVARTYKRLTGKDPVFIFSGWGGELDEPERAVVEDREPSEEVRSEVKDLLAAHRAALASTVPSEEQPRDVHKCASCTKPIPAGWRLCDACVDAPGVEQPGGGG